MNGPRASRQTRLTTRPQLVREHWADLSGLWRFDYDDDEVGSAERWWSGDRAWGRTITVPFPPESPASGIGDTGFHDVVWYQRDVSWADVLTAGYDADQRPRLVLRFGAVDYRCTVWFNGDPPRRPRGRAHSVRLRPPRIT